MKWTKEHVEFNWCGEGLHSVVQTSMPLCGASGTQWNSRWVDTSSDKGPRPPSMPSSTESMAEVACFMVTSKPENLITFATPVYIYCVVKILINLKDIVNAKNSPSRTWLRPAHDMWTAAGPGPNERPLSVVVGAQWRQTNHDEETLRGANRYVRPHPKME